MKLRNVLIGSAAALVLTAGGITAFAASQYDTPAEAVAGLTGKPVEEVIASESGKSYGAIAAENGVLEEFKEEKLEMKKDALADKVDSGAVTQEQADAIVERIEQKQAACDGTGSETCDGSLCGGVCTASGTGAQDGTGSGQGAGHHGGQGHSGGQKLRDGSCTK